MKTESVSHGLICKRGIIKTKGPASGRRIGETTTRDARQFLRVLPR